MTFFENLFAVFILLALFILGYCKLKNKTFSEAFNDIKEMFVGTTEEIDIR